MTLNFLNAESYLTEHIALQQGLNAESFIAIDEVGRGCVAGPVLTCASLWVKKNSLHSIPFSFPSWISKIKDSKKLSPAKRLDCYESVLAHFNLSRAHAPLRSPVHIPGLTLYHPKFVMPFAMPTELTHKVNSHFECVGFCLGEGSVAEVEEFNIWNAVQIAASRAMLGLHEQFHQVVNLSPLSCVLLMDGNKPIRVPEEFSKSLQITVIKGDDLFLSVGLSSIMAKVHRDEFMEKLCGQYPQFGFSRHKGYGTADHLSRIQQHGPSPWHRLSFLKNYLP